MTADTAHRACLHDILALVLRAALYNVLCVIRNQLDKVLRTCLYTLTAGLTGERIDTCHSVNHMD